MVIAKPTGSGAQGNAEKRAPVAVSIMLGMLMLMTFDLVPGAIAVIVVPLLFPF